MRSNDIKKMFAVTFMAMTITGCATTSKSAPIVSASSGAYVPTGISYTVKTGDTLWSIARHHRIDVETLARANALHSSSIISSGQMLRIPASPERASQIKPVYRPKNSQVFISAKDSFLWPARGQLLSVFGDKINGTNNKGIDIKIPEGSDVRASRAGKVVYSDSRMKGFGKTVILDHGDKFQTVYAYNSDILVRVGDVIRQNEVIAKAGKTGRAKEPSLHFEIRKDGEPRDPVMYLPR